MGDVLKFPAGSAIAFTSGEYSDYRFHGVMTALKEIDLPELAKAYATEKRAEPNTEWAWVSMKEFPPWLITHGYMMAADVETVHLGEYGRFAEEFGVPDDA